VVDWTSIPFQEDAMREWRRRIRVVYGDAPGGGFVALQGLSAITGLSRPSSWRSFRPSSMRRSR